MREFVSDYFPLTGDQTLARLTYGMAIARDQLKAADIVGTLDTLSRLLVACEQASLDTGPFNRRWDIAWLMSHLPEPPWHRFQNAARNRSQGSAVDGKFPLLAEPAWVATAMAYITDCAHLDEARRKLGKGKRKGKDDEDSPLPKNQKK